MTKSTPSPECPGPTPTSRQSAYSSATSSFLTARLPGRQAHHFSPSAWKAHAHDRTRNGPGPARHHRHGIRLRNRLRLPTPSTTLYSIKNGVISRHPPNLGRHHPAWASEPSQTLVNFRPRIRRRRIPARQKAWLILRPLTRRPPDPRAHQPHRQDFHHIRRRRRHHTPPSHRPRHIPPRRRPQRPRRQRAQTLAFAVGHLHPSPRRRQRPLAEDIIRNRQSHWQDTPVPRRLHRRPHRTEPGHRRLLRPAQRQVQPLHRQGLHRRRDLRRPADRPRCRIRRDHHRRHQLQHQLALPALHFPGPAGTAVILRGVLYTAPAHPP